MKVILFGATGMVGQGVLREALQAPEVERVLVVVRVATGLSHPKLQELVHRDFTDFTDVAAGLGGFEECRWLDDGNGLGARRRWLRQPEWLLHSPLFRRRRRGGANDPSASVRSAWGNSSREAELSTGLQSLPYRQGPLALLPSRG